MFIRMFIFLALAVILAEYVLLICVKRLHTGPESSLKKKRWIIRISLILTIVYFISFILTLYFRPANFGSMQPAVYVFILLGIPLLFFLCYSLLAVVPFIFWKSNAVRKYARKALFTGIMLMTLAFGVLLYGGIIGWRLLKVERIQITAASLPDSFDTLKIVQVSDLHLGSFGKDTAFIQRMVTEINHLNPDIVAFTGDLVTIKSSEAVPFVSVLSGIRAKYGVYAVLGNHDYGDYYQWNSGRDKEKDVQDLVEMQKKMGWKLLNDTTVYIRNGADSISITGVQNMGDASFREYGNLTKALKSAQTGDNRVFTILLSHNPKLWRRDIVPSIPMDLTLSGHTHAMQIKLGRFSPSKWIYGDWNGLYTEGDQYLYVNRGIGCALVPMRIGARPEITLIEIIPASNKTVHSFTGLFLTRKAEKLSGCL